MLESILIESDILITYTPLTDEVDYSKLSILNYFNKKVVCLPSDKSTDPFVLANKYMGLYKDKKVSILIPGQKFDISGTRHGRGGGWYDKFLSKVPKSWIWIGLSLRIR